MAAPINRNRVLVGGILGGVAWNLWSIIINVGMLGKRYPEAQAAREFLPEPRYAFFPVAYIVILLAMGIGVAWLYAVSRNTLTPGPGSAMKVGLVVGIVSTLPMNFALSAWFPGSRMFPLGWTLEGLIGCILAALVAGWYYKD